MQRRGWGRIFGALNRFGLQSSHPRFGLRRIGVWVSAFRIVRKRSVARGERSSSGDETRSACDDRQTLTELALIVTPSIDRQCARRTVERIGVVIANGARGLGRIEPARDAGLGVGQLARAVIDVREGDDLRAGGVDMGFADKIAVQADRPRRRRRHIPFVPRRRPRGG